MLATRAACLGSGVFAAILFAFAALPGCRPASQSAPVGPTSPEPVPVETTPATPVDCGPRGERFSTLGWVPTPARVLAAVELADPTLKEATSTLRAGTQDTAHKLPIRTAFSLGQWTWQLPLLQRTLANAGFYPDQLVYVSLPDGTSIWAWASSCDLETATQHVEASWGLTLRATPYGALGLAPRDESGTPLFAYDLIVWGASFFALVPAGRGPGTAQQIGEPRTSQASGLSGPLASLEAAPLRLVTRTDDLMAPGGATPQDTMLGHRILSDAWSTQAITAPLP